MPIIALPRSPTPSRGAVPPNAARPAKLAHTNTARPSPLPKNEQNRGGTQPSAPDGAGYLVLAGGPSGKKALFLTLSLDARRMRLHAV